ncbi:MAG: hypothetical protein NVSMB46_04780 [Candidatus Saccharimonadales bacterium]
MQPTLNKVITVFYYPRKIANRGVFTNTIISASLEVHDSSLRLSSQDPSSIDPLIFDLPLINVKSITRGKYWGIQMTNNDVYVIGTAWGKTATDKELKQWILSNSDLNSKFKDYIWVNYVSIPLGLILGGIILFVLTRR